MSSIKDLIDEGLLDSDPVNHPSHYTQGGIECVDALKASMYPLEFQGYLKGNCMKYIWRFRHKGRSVEDLQKAQWYLDRLTKEIMDDKETGD